MVYFFYVKNNYKRGTGNLTKLGISKSITEALIVNYHFLDAIASLDLGYESE